SAKPKAQAAVDPKAAAKGTAKAAAPAKGAGKGAAKGAAKPASAAVPKPAAKGAPAKQAKAAAVPVKPSPAPAKAGTKDKAAQAGAKVAAGKADAKGKPKAKEEVLEEDFADIEADLEADPETAAAEADAEERAKAKPLRMKVSRAKERALMREFGLDETALTEEEVNKRRLELKALIKMGKKDGYLTHQQISDHLPEKLVEHEILEAIVSMLNDMGIAVYEQAPDAALVLIEGGNAATATEEEAEEAAEAALSTVDSEFGRTTDPVRMYMREMGTVELLTREGEIEIAKRIEGGLQAMMVAISASPTTIAEILAMADKIAAGEVQISEVVDGFVAEDE
ncbi:MAG: RNA polymerase sigma factor region1.1 domain-containing protein, partial [Betaproteobacteria bacterium]